MASEEWSDDDPEAVPLQRRRPFGSGIKRKRVVFVPASSGNLDSTSESKPLESSKSVSDIYLSIVLPNETGKADSAGETDATKTDVCVICKLPVNKDSGDVGPGRPPSRPHEASIAHQVCIAHSHPPSALDRSRMGLGVLQSQGWDPDARTGLGASNQGISFPLKAKAKHDTLGLGVEVPKDMAVWKKEKPQMLNAKKVRKMVAEDKRRHEKLRHQFYGNDDVERYLGLS
ncbi:putative G-patch domain-containing protein [Rosellinia necatrix]|uniref:Putative G-patch domain-containing protein n=1 Tax=Rosellinia necatrix TaxID=77044 RepID=A0A1W2TEB6_ROSNE|nr:putative G-patch domain-containing protein [Rosellinia necatrix]